MGWVGYLFILFFIAGAFFVIAIFALTWAAKRGHLQHFEEQSKSIFDEDEPEGLEQDAFPGKAPKSINI